MENKVKLLFACVIVLLAAVAICGAFFGALWLGYELGFTM